MLMDEFWDAIDDSSIDSAELAKELLKWIGEWELERFNNEYEYFVTED